MSYVLKSVSPQGIYFIKELFVAANLWTGAETLRTVVSDRRLYRDTRRDPPPPFPGSQPKAMHTPGHPLSA